jgi:phage host-nuclease inhibitor protein Gam
MSKQEELKLALNYMIETSIRAEAMAKEVTALTREVKELKLKLSDEVKRVEENLQAKITKQLDKSNVTRAGIIAYMRAHNMIEGG